MLLKPSVAVPPVVTVYGPYSAGANGATGFNFGFMVGGEITGFNVGFVVGAVGDVEVEADGAIDCDGLMVGYDDVVGDDDGDGLIDGAGTNGIEKLVTSDTQNIAPSAITFQSKVFTL